MHTQPKEAHLIFQGGGGYLKTNILLMERKGKSYFLEWQNAISLNKFSMSQKIDFTENIENWQKGKKTNVECVLCRKV